MNILLTGFFGEGNLGDDSILRAIFANLNKNDQLVFTSGNSPTISGPIPIKRKGFLSWPLFLNALKDSNATVFSGGILQDWTFDGTIFFALRILAAASFNKRPSLWGAGMGPIRSKAARRIAAKAINRLETAWLRDDFSIETFRRIKSQKANVNLNRGTDFSWHFKIEFLEKSQLNGPLGLNLRPWVFSSDWKKNIINQLKFIDRHMIGIAARKSDVATIKKYSPKATLLIPDSFQRSAQICRQLGCGIAMRYHIGLAMLRSGIPTKLIGYDPKVVNLAQKAGIELLKSNSLSGFKVANKDFLISEQKQYSSMQQAFKEYLTEK